MEINRIDDCRFYSHRSPLDMAIQLLYISLMVTYGFEPKSCRRIGSPVTLMFGRGAYRDGDPPVCFVFS